MLCKSPYTTPKGEAYGCGQCLPCRINRRRIWAHRIQLEMAQYEENAFVTLTYDPELVPRLSGPTTETLETLAPRDLTLWLKRLREKMAPHRFRYFAVGEYGDETFRPHYHAILFGFGPCRYGKTRKHNCCSACDVVRDTWGKGIIELRTVDAGGAEYVAGYTTKKMTHADDPRLLGRIPEFARMSRMPGIGVSALWDQADVIMRYGIEKKETDVPFQMRHGKTLKPLGRTLRRKLRTYVGKDENAPPETLYHSQAELQPLREAAKEIAGTGPGSSERYKVILKNQIIDTFAHRVEMKERKARIFKKRGSI